MLRVEQEKGTAFKATWARLLIEGGSSIYKVDRLPTFVTCKLRILQQQAVVVVQWGWCEKIVWFLASCGAEGWGWQGECWKWAAAAAAAVLVVKTMAEAGSHLNKEKMIVKLMMMVMVAVVNICA